MTKKECDSAIEKFELKRQIGDMVVTFPKIPKWDKIENHDLPKAKGKFYHTVQPARNQDPDDDFLKREAERISNGHWFYNNGNVEYITGHHYFFLNYWRDKKARYMKFLDSQREFFLWWDAIEKDDNLAGGVIIANRRFGKTQIGTCIIYIRSSTKYGQYSGLQSKTNTDAKGVFNKLIGSWSLLPEWLKPIDTGETRPAQILEFAEARRRGNSRDKKVYSEVLNSKIDYKSSNEGAYDGEELDTYLMDEAGKTIESKVDDTWVTAKKCLMRASDIRGKALITTTVEEMEKKGGKYFKIIWDDADVKKVNPKTGRNTSLLTRIFIGADWGYDGVHPLTKEPFVDEYGYSNREAARQYILDTWEPLEGEALAAEQRKDALTVKHAFQLKNFGGCFDNDLLEQQLDYLEGNNDRPEDNAPKNLIRRVTFYREYQKAENPMDDPIMVVKWRDDPKGHCEMVWDFNNPKLTNKKKPGPGGAWAPANEEGFAIGVDPVGSTMTTGTEKSQAVAYVYRKGDLNDPENSGLMILRFAPVQRMRFKSDFHKYVMMLCEYYGCKANYESNIDDYYEKFIEEGFKNYIMWRPKSTIDPMRKNVRTKYGTPSNDPFALQKQTDIADEYIKTRFHKIYFLELVKQLIAFDPDDRTKFDDCIAFFMALIAGTERKTDNKPKLNGLSIIPVLKNVG